MKPLIAIPMGDAAGIGRKLPLKLLHLKRHSNMPE